MSYKIASSNFFYFTSFLSALFGLFFFFFYKIPYLTNYISLDINKNLILLSFTSLSLTFYLISNIMSKHILLPENKWVRIIFSLFYAIIIISTLFSGDIFNSFFGKYVYLQSGITYFSIISLVYVLASNIKKHKRIAWSFLFLGSLFVTLPSILAVIFFKFDLINLSNKAAYFIDNWDTVALTSGIIVVISLIYFETIASSKFQKILSGSLIAIHMLLLICIVIPDIWYALFCSILFIFLMSKNKKYFYKKFSFYISILSLLFSILYIFSNGGWTSNITNKIISFTTKYSEINYSFVKPKLGLSINVVKSELLKGKLFGAGPNEFYRVWQLQKPQSVINSTYWNTDFYSSYSAFTTLIISLGVVGTLLFVIVYIVLGINLYKKIKEDLYKEEEDIDYENRFYLLGSITLFIFSFFIFIFFTNIPSALILFAVSVALILPNTIKWKEPKNRTFVIIPIILLVLTIFGLIISLNRIRAIYLIENSIKNYKNNSINLRTLENNLIKFVNISNNDTNHRLLSQFYIYKIKLILSNNATTTELLQQEVITYVDNAINNAKTAIQIDKKDFNNYLNLGSVYEFIMTFDQENKERDYLLAKESYNKALELYPKNPSIYLNLAQLEYNYQKNATTTIENLNKSLQIKPNYSQAYYLFSQLSVQENEVNNAIQFALKSIEAEPQNIDALLQYGILLINKKELSKEELNQAYTAFTSVLNIDGNNVTAAYYLAVTYILAGEYDQAKNIINTLKQVLPNEQKVIDLEGVLVNAQKNNIKTESKTEDKAVNEKNDSNTKSKTSSE